LLLGTTYSDSTTARSYQYNHLGQLTQVVDDAGTRTIGYNRYGEPETDSLTAGGVTHLITETRDAMGRSAGYAYAKKGTVQQAVTTGYGSDGRISSAGFLHGGSEKQFGYSYLPGTNLLQTLTMPCSMTLTQSYEANRDLLIGMAYRRGTTSVAERAYTYNTLGRPLTRRTARKGATVNDTFAYSNRSELTEATVSGAAYSYAYDNIGNRKSAQEAAEEATTYTANALNQYTAIDEFVPTYDADGNQTLVKTSTGIWTVAYNAENRPITFTNNENNTVIECAYDSMGRRATKKVTINNSITLNQRYIYRGYLQIACCDLTRSAHPCLWLITWDPTQPVATRPLAIQKSGTWYCYGWDLTKNICEVFGSNGYINTIYTYTPYGGVTSSGSTTQPLQWSSEFYDTELGLVYYNFRHYNPICAQWITIDPLLRYRKETGYGYVRSLSIIYIDYLGLLFNQQQPHPPNTSERRKECSDAGLKEPDRKAKESCESYVKNAMKAKKIVDLIAVLAQNKCDVPPVVCKCCQDECKGAGGWHFSDKIVMCTNGNQSRINTTNYLGHELTHHLQKCQKRSGGSCINSLKNEVEAYKTHIKGCKNIVSSAQGSVLLGGQCKKEELTKEVIKEATEYCESLK